MYNHFSVPNLRIDYIKFYCEFYSSFNLINIRNSKIDEPEANKETKK